MQRKREVERVCKYKSYLNTSGNDEFKIVFIGATSVGTREQLIRIMKMKQVPQSAATIRLESLFV